METEMWEKTQGKVKKEAHKAAMDWLPDSGQEFSHASGSLRHSESFRAVGT
jgi:hypothetical protein